MFKSYVFKVAICIFPGIAGWLKKKIDAGWPTQIKITVAF